MSLCFEKARELGELILQSEQSINLTDASANYSNNPDARKLVEDYNAYRNNVQQSMQANSLSEEEMKKASDRLAELAVELKQDPVVGALIYAETEFNQFVNQVMNIVKYTVTGEPAQADGCAGCAGCSPESGCSGCSQ